MSRLLPIFEHFFTFYGSYLARIKPQPKTDGRFVFSDLKTPTPVLNSREKILQKIEKYNGVNLAIFAKIHQLSAPTLAFLN